MDMTKTGGPAFPSFATINGNETHFFGATLRDYFAANAMQGYLAGVNEPNIEYSADFSYRMADAMLKARAK